MGAAAQTLTIDGTNFMSSSTVTYNNVAHTAMYVGLDPANDFSLMPATKRLQDLLRWQ